MAAAAVGALLWAVPLVYTTGGLAGYLKALGGQGQEDFAGVEMLATTPSWSLFQSAMGRTFIDPWQAKTLAHVVLVLALVRSRPCSHGASGQRSGSSPSRFCRISPFTWRFRKP